jgi:hypothetical protein
MNPKANPIAKHGERNIYCPYYDDCLDHAVKYCWEFWNCSTCPYKLIERSTAEYERSNQDA